ncbi:MAG TPA: class I SAM-dependent methyltransferase, partial [Vicinamibacteria bacterium]|nr:class I SAM-dependent methyltransferase [Vicinamibacteria bacterium]
RLSPMSAPPSAPLNAYQYQDLLVRGRDPYAHAKYQVILGHLGQASPQRILNAGCGSGDLSFLLGALGHEVVGIDPGSAYIDLARSRAAEGPGCTFEVASIESYEPAKPFDCVIATDVLEHIEDDHAAYRKLVRLVSPSGLIVLTVPAGQWLFGYHDEQLGHFRRYSRRSLRALAETASTVEDVRYFGVCLVPVCLWYSRWMRRPYPVAESADTRARPLTAPILRAVLAAERRMRPPTGTSLILKARPR